MIASLTISSNASPSQPRQPLGEDPPPRCRPDASSPDRARDEEPPAQARRNGSRHHVTLVPGPWSGPERNFLPDQGRPLPPESGVGEPESRTPGGGLGNAGPSRPAPLRRPARRTARAGGRTSPPRTTVALFRQGGVGFQETARNRGRSPTTASHCRGRRVPPRSSDASTFGTPPNSVHSVRDAAGGPARPRSPQTSKTVPRSQGPRGMLKSVRP